MVPRLAGHRQPGSAAGLQTANSILLAWKLSPLCPQGDPAVLRLPENYRLTAGADQRTAAVASATAAVDAEHASFASAAAGIT